MKHLLLAFALLAAPFAADAQNEYLQHDPAWTILQIRSQSYPCVQYDTTTFYLSGDSIYNNLTYKKIWAKGSVHYQWWAPNPNPWCYGDNTYVDTIPTGLIRSAGTQMFFIQWTNTAEEMIYDFNLTVGDHPPFCWLTTSDTTITVTSIDSLYTPYGYRKRFYFNNSSEYMIEGVGSSYGLHHYFGPMLDFASQFLCYSLNDTTWLPQPGPSCEAIITSVEPAPVVQTAVNLFPNPSSDQVMIKAAMKGTLVISDALGRIVYNGSHMNQSTVNVSDLAPGIYLARIYNDSESVVKEFVVE